jgi:hypothetical protein
MGRARGTTLKSTALTRPEARSIVPSAGPARRPFSAWATTLHQCRRQPPAPPPLPLPCASSPSRHSLPPRGPAIIAARCARGSRADRRRRERKAEPRQPAPLSPSGSRPGPLRRPPLGSPSLSLAAAVGSVGISLSQTVIPSVCAAATIAAAACQHGRVGAKPAEPDGPAPARWVNRAVVPARHEKRP